MKHIGCDGYIVRGSLSHFEAVYLHFTGVEEGLALHQGVRLVVGMFREIAAEKAQVLVAIFDDQQSPPHCPTSFSLIESVAELSNRETEVVEAQLDLAGVALRVALEQMAGDALEVTTAADVELLEVLTLGGPARVVERVCGLDLDDETDVILEVTSEVLEERNDEEVQDECSICLPETVMMPCCGNKNISK